MFNDPEILKLMVFALFGVVGVETIVLIYLAVKKNIYYIDEKGNVRTGKGKGVKKAQPMGEVQTVQEPKPVQPVTPLEQPIEVKASVLQGVEVIITIDGVSAPCTITSFPCLIGRDRAACGLPISESAVSRRHAQLLVENGNLYLEDVSEHNGTYLNGTKLPPLGRARLHEQDRISLGRAEIDIVKMMY